MNKIISGIILALSFFIFCSSSYEEAKYTKRFTIIEDGRIERPGYRANYYAIYKDNITGKTYLSIGKGVVELNGE